MAVIVHMRMDDHTKTYVARRTAEGLSKLEIIRVQAISGHLLSTAARKSLTR